MVTVKSEAIAGGAAGVIGTVLGFPLDCIKTRMQTTHTSMFNASKIIFSESGIMGFYRGIASPILSLTILNTLNFSTYSHFRSLLNKHGNESKIDTSHLFNWRVPVAGAMIAPFCTCLSTPFELVKTQMQLNVAKSTANLASVSVPQSNSSVKTAYNIVKTHGIRALYTGFGINGVRELVFLVTYWTVYENIKLLLTTTTSQYIPASVSIAMAGGLSGAAGWFLSFPLDLIKSNIQGRPFVLAVTDNSNSSVQNKLHSTVSSGSSGSSGSSSAGVATSRQSALEIGRNLLKTRGLLGLYSGVIPSLMRAFIVSSSRFMVYEGTLEMLEKRQKTI